MNFSNLLNLDVNSGFLSILKFVLMVYLGVGIFLYIKQRSFIYFPTKEASIEYVNYFQLVSSNEKIRVWEVNPGKEHAILYFGGNMESVEFNIRPYQQLFPDHTVYLMNYRGYGGSSGSPSESALNDDSLALYDAIVNQHRKISIIGRSLGSGVATYVAVNREVDRLVLVTPYDSLESVAQGAYPMYPMSFLFKDKFDSYRRAKEIRADVLIIIAEYDEVIRRKHSDRLYNGLIEVGARVDVSIIPGAGHNTVSESLLYSRLLQQFLGDGMEAQ